MEFTKVELSSSPFNGSQGTVALEDGEGVRTLISFKVTPFQGDVATSTGDDMRRFEAALKKRILDSYPGHVARRVNYARRYRKVHER